MKASELQIGDFVLVNDKPVKVESITKKKIGYHLKGNECHIHYARLHDLKPIPITSDILLKNGFKTDVMYSTFDLGNGMHLEYYHYEHRLRIWYNGIDEWNNHQEENEIIFLCNPSYIHELQNALRLRKIDKEIEL